MADGFFDNWTTQLRKGLLELCVLSAIRSQRLYGYDIVKRLREIEGLVISEGTIYPILSRFKREGLVSATVEESHEGPPRKYYQLTPAGRQQLQQMIRYWRLIAGGVDKLQEK
ncbi:MAG: PadR family transcriptional regulator [Planctomycetota bacterium]|nr:PadR family transcriptional regulator [Planctomycetota bacterium]